MKKSKLIILTNLLIVTLIGFNSKVVANASANNMPSPSQTYLSENDDVEAFYTSSNAGSVKGLKNDELLEQLAKIMSEKHRYYTSYDEVRGANALSDECLTDSTKVIAFYGGIPISNQWQPTNYSDVEAWNREHVWCKSLSGGLYTSVSGSTRNAGTDIHQLKPSVQKLNSTRNNLLYADLNKQGNELIYEHTSGTIHTGNFYNSTAFEPRDDIKGDVARILMYMYTHYSSEVDNSTASKKGDLKIQNIVYTQDNSAQSAWNVLLKWNSFDPVDEFESKRNNYCASITGVRNPFVDHPEFATMIWSTSYNGAGALIDGEEGPYLTLINGSTNLKISETYQIYPATNIKDGKFTYTSLNNEVATVSDNGLVSAISLGKAEIVVSCGDLSATFTVNVIEEEPIALRWELVTDNSALEIDGSYFIASLQDEVALSTYQKANNRGQANIIKSNQYAQITDEVQILTLKSGVVENSYAFNTGDGYLYAASGKNANNNYLKTKEELDATASFTIDIASNGNATIVAVDEDTVKNTLRHNSSSSLFSCYSYTNTQKDVCLYKLIEVENFSTTVSVNLKYSATYAIDNDVASFYSASNYALVFNGQIYEEFNVDNYDFGYIVASKKQLDNSGYSSFEEMYQQNGSSLNNLKVALNAINGEVKVDNNVLSYTFTSFDNLDNEYVIAFYATNKNTNYTLFASTKSFSLIKVIDMYLTNSYLLDNMDNKEDIIKALNYMKEHK